MVLGALFSAGCWSQCPIAPRGASKLEPAGNAARSFEATPGLRHRFTNQRNRNTKRTARPTAQPRPVTRNLPNGGMAVSHQEHCSVLNLNTSVPGGTNRNTNVKENHIPLKLPFNPGDGRTFPWLNTIATRFERYKFTKLKFHYKPIVSTFSNGGVALCPIYDPADPIPSDRSALLNAEGTVRGAIYHELTLVIPQTRMRKNDTMFVRETHESLADVNELRLSDLGFLAVSLTDVSLTALQNNVGEVYVEYTVELSSPRIGPRTAKSGYYRRDNYTNTGANEGPGNSSPFHAAPFGNVTPEDRTNHSPGNTVMFDVGTQLELYQNSDTNDPIETNTITFREPFCGTMQYFHRADGNAQGGSVGGLIVNDPEVMDLVQGNDHKGDWAQTGLLRSIVSGAGIASQLWKVVAQAGDVMQLSWLEPFADAIDFAEVLFTDVAPELLTLL